LRGVA